MLSSRFGPRNLGALALVLAAAACQTEREYGPASACKGASCGRNGGVVGGSGEDGEGGGSGGVGGGAASVDQVIGKVGLILAPSFNSVTPFAEEATVLADTKGGGKTSAAYTASSFTLEDVAAGETWFEVQVLSQSAFSTFSLQKVPPQAPLVLPVIDIDMMSAIISLLPNPEVLDPGDAQIVLKFQRDGLPLEGVQLASSIDAIVAYDDGAGAYSNDAVATGPAGTMLLLNVAASPNEGLKEIAVTADGTQDPISLPSLKFAAGKATIAGFLVP